MSVVIPLRFGGYLLLQQSWLITLERNEGKEGIKEKEREWVLFKESSMWGGKKTKQNTCQLWTKLGQFSSVQSLTHAWLFATLWTVALHDSLSLTNSQRLLSCPLSWWCRPTISSSVSPSCPAFNLSQHQSLFNESALCIRWPKYWNFSFSISRSN